MGAFPLVGRETTCELVLSKEELRIGGVGRVIKFRQKKMGRV